MSSRSASMIGWSGLATTTGAGAGAGGAGAAAVQAPGSARSRRGRRARRRSRRGRRGDILEGRRRKVGRIGQVDGGRAGRLRVGAATSAAVGGGTLAGSGSGTAASIACWFVWPAPARPRGGEAQGQRDRGSGQKAVKTRPCMEQFPRIPRGRTQNTDPNRTRPGKAAPSPPKMNSTPNCPTKSTADKRRGSSQARNSATSVTRSPRFLRRSRRVARAKPDFVELAVESRAADAQPARDFGHLPAIARDGGSNHLRLDLFQRPDMAVGVGERERVAAATGCGAACGRRDLVEDGAASASRDLRRFRPAQARSRGRDARRASASCGNSCAPTSSPSASTTARNTAFSSWRTLPGQGCALSTPSASADDGADAFPSSAAKRTRKWRTSSGMSSGRSRSGGTVIGNTCRR